jgi:hypothetical protein
MWCSRIAIASLFVASAASADKATADLAFSEAKKLMAAGKIAEACPKFELSNKQDPQLGTLLNLADCHEQLGKLATAWAEFREAIDLAKNKKDEREAFAKERSEKLAPRVSHVTLVKQSAAAFTVTLDGRDVTALVGIGIPVDPGEHVIATRAGDAAEQSAKVTIDKDGQKLDVRVPIEAAAVIETPPPKKSMRKVAAIATAGAGLAAAGIGLYFGKRAFDQYDDSREFCDDNNRCEPRGAKLIDDANSSAITSNILIGVGVGAIAVGAVLWFTAPKERRSAVTARPVVGPRGVAAEIELRF